jgi:hypothetical protein
MTRRQSDGIVEISWYRARRRELREPFALAEESPAVIEELLDLGSVLVASLDDQIV